MKRSTWIGCVLALGAGLAACGDESPTTVGGSLLGEGVRTVEVVLDAPDFLQGDSTYDSIGRLNDAGFGIVAQDFAGELDANVLFSIRRPITVSYVDPSGATQIDSVVSIGGGTLRVIIDTLTGVQPPVDFEVVDVTESWDPATVGWTNRVDSAGVVLPWSTAGGALGATLATVTWQGGDTLLIPLDSATASVWHDTAAARAGGALRITTPGTRLRLQTVGFSFEVVPVDTDTVLNAGEITDEITVASPDAAPTADDLRVGGLPAWRSLLHFRPLGDVMVPCETGSTTCTVPLSDATINSANLLLRTQPVGGRRPERPLRLEGRAILEAPGVPLIRSPLSLAFGRMQDSLTADAFATPPVLVRVPVTGYIERLLDAPDGEDPLLWLALTSQAEKAFFGYGEFGSITSPVPPRLQLVVSIPEREVTP